MTTREIVIGFRYPKAFAEALKHMRLGKLDEGIVFELTKRESLEIAIKNGADINYGGGGHTALYDAVYRGNEDRVKILLSLGADPNRATQYGSTPLHELVYNYGNTLSSREMDAPAKGTTLSKYRRIAKALIGAGAKPEAKDKQGLTPLGGARKLGDEELLQVLLGK